MNNNRREFLKLGVLASAGVIISLFSPVSGSAASTDVERKTGKQKFNMSGYAAPKLDRVRIGFIGLGTRGPAHLTQTSKVEGVEIKALCDIRAEKVNAAKKKIENNTNNPVLYSAKDDWKKLCERDDIDLVYISTPWDLHAPIALYAMEHGKHVAIDVPGATTVEHSWKLVETSERTRRHCMMLENICCDFFELLTLNMARQGFFGDIVHGEGAEYRSVAEKYTPAIMKKVGEMAKQVGGHGGMDFLMNWRLIDCLSNGVPVNIDVYDIASWGSIGPLSEVSVAKRSTVEIPDFTCGAWKTNKPLDMHLKQGGTTKVLVLNHRQFLRWKLI